MTAAERVAEARRLVAAATPGPWGPVVYRGTGLGWDVDTPEAGIRGQFEEEADAELIAASPRLLVGLADDLDAAQARIAELEAAIEGIHAPTDEEAEVWWDDDHHHEWYPDCTDERDCEGHVRTITVCSECGYYHDGESPIFRSWPCPTRRAVSRGAAAVSGDGEAG